MKNLLLLLSLSLLLASCGDSNEKIKIEGQFFGQPTKTIFLEQLSPSGSSIVDSTITDKNGNFKFKISNPNPVPTFYNIMLGGSTYVPILTQAGENIYISAVGNIFYNYKVEGSKGSDLIKEYNSLLRNTTLAMDSLMNIYERTNSSDERNEIGVQYGQKYINLKRNAIRFVVTNANSLAALLPLYHPRSDGQFLFDQPEDYIYFKMVSDSLSKKYPTSPYTRSMQNDIQKIIDAHTTDSMLTSQINDGNNLVDFPDIAMTDATGVKRKLSDYKGQIILLDFTASQPTELKVLNRELVELYNRNKDKKMVVFQVSLDVNKSTWLNTVSEARLPWISVCDFLGENSTPVKIYNVKKIPANFLIDQEGNIVATNIRGAQLQAALDNLTK